MTSFGKTSVAIVVLLCFCTGRVYSAIAVSSSRAVSNGPGIVSSSASANAADGGVAVAIDSVEGRGGANVKSSTTADANGKGAVAVAKTNLYVAGNADITANNFAQAVQDGEGPVIAKSIVDAIAIGNEDQVLQGYVDGVAIAIGKTSANIATIAKTTVDVFFFGSGPQAAFGKAVSILLTKGCGFAQPFLQQVEANVSSRGKQQAFLTSINTDVNIIKCVFPDTCKNDGVDQRGGCCRSSNAASSGSCGMCDKGGCKHTQIWTNPKGIWVCNQGVPCGNMKPCICS